jgi:cell division protein FtsB
MEFRQEMAKKQSSEKTGREEALENLLEDHRASAFEDAKTISQLKSQVALLEERIGDMSSDMVGDASSIKTLKEEREMLEKNVKYLRDENERLKAEVNALEQPEKPTMPVIPKAVAIAIFREGVQHGVESACTELDEDCFIRIEESEYVGDFHVTFERDIDLNDHVDTDWMRGKCGDYSEETIIDALGTLCADKEFECRIHGVDDNPAKE